MTSICLTPRQLFSCQYQYPWYKQLSMCIGRLSQKYLLILHHNQPSACSRVFVHVLVTRQLDLAILQSSPTHLYHPELPSTPYGLTPDPFPPYIQVLSFYWYYKLCLLYSWIHSRFSSPYRAALFISLEKDATIIEHSDMSRASLPQDIVLLLCQELSFRCDFSTLFQCSLVSRRVASLALEQLYRYWYVCH